VTASDIFSDAKTLIAGAKEDFAELNAGLAAFSKEAQYTFTADYDEKAGTDSHKVKLVSRFPERLSRLTAHIAGDLRVALDQAGYACAQAHGKVKPREFEATLRRLPSTATDSDFANTRPTPSGSSLLASAEWAARSTVGNPCATATATLSRSNPQPTRGKCNTVPQLLPPRSRVARYDGLKRCFRCLSVYAQQIPSRLNLP